MHINFQDPLILIPVVVIVLGLVALFWALGRLLKRTPDPADLTLTDQFPPLSSDTELFNADTLPEAPLSSVEDRPVASSAVPGTNREMASRLDNMTQKLSDMQAVLQRQAAGSPAGTPLTPETIDKLLKIIGNVTQQVDLLQKSLGAPAAAGAPAAIPAPAVARAIPPAAAPAPAATAPAAAPAPAPAPTAAPAKAPPAAAVPPKPLYTPTAVPAPAVGGKSIGVTGGALSSMGKKPLPEQKPGVMPGKPPATPGAPSQNPPPDK